MKLVPFKRLFDYSKLLRMSISDVFKGQSSGISVVGRVESGSVMKEDRLLATPTNDICQVKSVLVEQMDGQIGKYLYEIGCISFIFTSRHYTCIGFCKTPYHFLISPPPTNLQNTLKFILEEIKLTASIVKLAPVYMLFSS